MGAMGAMGMATKPEGGSGTIGRHQSNASMTETSWEDDGWTVECPGCGVTHDDGQEMIECESCRIWMHIACVMVPKGIEHYICERCSGAKKEVRRRYRDLLSALKDSLLGWSVVSFRVQLEIRF